MSGSNGSVPAARVEAVAYFVAVGLAVAVRVRAQGVSAVSGDLVAVAESVPVRVCVRWESVEGVHFGSVVQAVAIRVGEHGIRAQGVDLSPVREPVAVGIRGPRIGVVGEFGEIRESVRIEVLRRVARICRVQTVDSLPPVREAVAVGIDAFLHDLGDEQRLRVVGRGVSLDVSG